VAATAANLSAPRASDGAIYCWNGRATLSSFRNSRW